MTSTPIIRTECDGIAIIQADNPPVNAISLAVREGILAEIEAAERDDAVKAIVIWCAGRTFFAGADIKEFDAGPRPPLSGDVVGRIEACSKPVIAAIHGTALGGGLELAMGCHWRVATTDARLGLPEVTLGIIPGAGGTQRLPRLVGFNRALEMITLGRPIDATSALAIGLVDMVVEGDLLAAAVKTAREHLSRAIRRTGELPFPAVEADACTAFRLANARHLKAEAPNAAIELLIESALLSLSEGLMRERSTSTALRQGGQARALRYAFFAEREARKVPDLEGAAIAPLTLRTVGVVGAGTMGRGIALSLLTSGFRVVLVEQSDNALEAGVKAIRATLENQAAKGRLDGLASEAMLRLKGSMSLVDLADCDLIIEAAFELMTIKKSIFAELDKVARRDAVLATNTSFLDVDEIASATTRPEQVVGLHFFSPANVMKLLEIVRGRLTSLPVLAASLELAKRIGKIPVVAGVCYGFIGNRMLARRRAVVDAMILEGVTPWRIDAVLKSFGMAMGPFQTSDLAGLDLGWTREASTGATVRQVLNEMGRHGQKSGAGYYDYIDGKPAPSAIVEEAIARFASQRGIPQSTMSDTEVLERSLLPMIDEGYRILQEGIAQRASDVDVVWLNGYGWPRWRGGPMQYASEYGLPATVEKLAEFERKYGELYRPSTALRTAAATKGLTAGVIVR